MSRTLPRSLDDLGGLRAARWLRESTAGQYDRFGPEAQRDQQDRAMDRYGLVDTGIEWLVAHSGRTIGGTSTFAEMMESAGRDYDVLVVGYVSRFARDLRTAVNARHDLHRAGASILFADERVLSSDEESWETWAREAVEAEAYSRRLGKRVREGYAAKFRRLADPGGNPPLGFRRQGEARTLAIDPATIGQAIALFERYAGAMVSIDELAAEARMNPEGLKDLLKNPIYNGWVRRRGEMAPAPWRASPPVSDALWAACAAVRDRRRRGGGPRVPGRVDLLRGLVRCGCGSSVRAWGMVSGRHRRRHSEAVPCPAGASQTLLTTERFEEAIAAQLAGVRLDDATIGSVVRILAEPEPAPPSIDRARTDRRRRELALDFAAGRLSAGDFQTAIAGLSLAEEQAPAPAVSAADAVRYLRDLPDLWAGATREEQAGLIAAVYDEIVVRDYEVVKVRLTPAAQAMGLALALPERVHVWQERARRDSNPRPCGPKPHALVR